VRLFVCDRTHTQNASTHARHASVLGPYWQPVAGCAAGDLQKVHSMTTRSLSPTSPEVSILRAVATDATGRERVEPCSRVCGISPSGRRRVTADGVHVGRSWLREGGAARRGGRPGPGTPAARPEGGDEPEATEEEERWLRCASCGARVVREAARLVVNGSHEHCFLNPSGIRYVVGCWAAAPGCVAEGERSAVWTWFPGYAWQVELCRSCSTHLGWSFHAATSFYALIRELLL